MTELNRVGQLIRCRFGLVRLYYIALTLLIMAPLLGRGFVLTLDMVFAPDFQLPAASRSSYLFYVVLKLLNWVLPADVIQKILLCLITYLSGLGLYRLGWLLLPPAQRIRQLSLLLAGTFFVLNPYTYSRFMAGQFAVLLGYALLPWFFITLYDFHNKPSRLSALRFGVLGALVAILSIHSLGLIILASGWALVLQVYRSRGRWSAVKLYVYNGLIMLGVGSVLSVNWLVPLLIRRGSIEETISRFNAQDSRVFQTIGDNPLLQIINILHLQGFWAEARNLYKLPQINPLWGLISTAILLLIGYGLLIMWRRRRAEAVYFIGLMGLATIIAMGGLQPLSRLIPLFNGYREPHKFVGLVALVFSLALGFGCYQLLSRVKSSAHIQQKLYFVGLFGLIMVYTPTMLWGFGGQLKPVNYPAGWYQVSQIIQRDQSDYQVLFLPWHKYMSFKFTRDRIVANPAPLFFKSPILISDDFEFGGIGRSSNDPRLSNLSRWLKQPANTTLPQRLAKDDIKYIVLAQDLDYSAYSKLVQQPVFDLIYQNKDIRLYRNRLWRQP